MNNSLSSKSAFSEEYSIIDWLSYTFNLTRKKTRWTYSTYVEQYDSFYLLLVVPIFLTNKHHSNNDENALIDSYNTRRSRTSRPQSQSQSKSQSPCCSPPVSNTLTHHHPTTIYNLSDDILRKSHAFLGVGHFRYHGIVCKMFLRASDQTGGYRKITTGEKVTSSISCARKYFEDEGAGEDQVRFFWYSAARHGRVEIMRWAHRQGYTSIWT